MICTEQLVLEYLSCNYYTCLVYKGKDFNQLADIHTVVLHVYFKGDVTVLSTLPKDLYDNF